MPEQIYTNPDLPDQSWSVVAPEGIAAAVADGMAEQGWVLQTTETADESTAAQAAPNAEAAALSPRLSSKPQTAATPEGN